MKKNISILGSTGSVGLSTLQIIDKRKNFFKIILLAANNNFRLICNQIKKYKPEYFIVNNFKVYLKVKEKFKNKQVKIFNNFEKINLKKLDLSVAAIPGIAGLEPTLLFIKLSKKILIANKESIICGWPLMKKLASKNNSTIIPVDSEHYSIFKLIENLDLKEIEKIYITASGGPFLNYRKQEMHKISPKDALKHPKWKMGKKISIDSATLMNKILELIEAQKLFNLPKNKIEILIHPNSLVHAIVEFNNGLTEFIYHETSMIIPLANALFDEKINIKDFLMNKDKNKKRKLIENLIFKRVNKNTFPIISLKERVNEHPSTSIIINAANEVLVDYFLRKKIPFLSIFKIIKTIMNDRNYNKYAIKEPKSISQILQIDQWSRRVIYKKVVAKKDA